MPSPYVREALRRKQFKLSWDLNRFFFDKQQEVYRAIESGERYVCLRCGRRSGKSTIAAALLVHYGLKHPKSTPLFVTMSRQDARDIVWPALDLLDEMYGLNLVFNRASGDVTIPHSQSVVKLRGAGSMLEINKLRGKKYPIAWVDEAQAFGPDFEYLLDEALEPATADYHGPLCISGTPNVAASGPFYEIDQGKHSDAWNHFSWTFLDNPNMPNPQEFIQKVMERRGWDINHPAYLREYMGQWIHDLESRAFKVDTHNIVDEFPEHRTDDWSYVMGVDVGFHDPFAFVVLAYSQVLGQAYVVDSYQESEIGTAEALTIAERFAAEYPLDQIAIDTGGAGRLVVEDWKKLAPFLPLEAAKKSHKHSQVDVINNDFQAGKLLIVEQQCRRLIHDLRVLEWDAELFDRNKFTYRKGYSDHLPDALQYGFALCHHHNYGRHVEDSVRFGTPEYYSRKEDAWEQAQLRRAQEREDEAEDVWSFLSDDAPLL